MNNLFHCPRVMTFEEPANDIVLPETIRPHEMEILEDPSVDLIV